MELIQDLKDFIRLLDAHDVRYLIVDGVAVNALGYVRTTEDIDFWLQRNEANAEKVLAALSEFGFDEFSREDLLDPKAPDAGPTAAPDRPVDLDLGARIR